MRVVSGSFKGRKLETAKTNDIRPTSDRVKEAMFNILGNGIVNSTFLDLFAGTGSMGIEAYSRGASQVVFVDSSYESIKVLKSNLIRFGIESNFKCYNTSYDTALEKLSSQLKEFDYIFIDPPYNKNMFSDIIKRINSLNILSENGIIIIEHSKKENLAEKLYKYELHKRKKYGNTNLSFYKTGK